jgi:hypothetical protein
MRRFVRNRWWAFILMLGIVLASGTTTPSPSYGGGTDPISIDGGSGGDPGGDPDSPLGPGKRGTGFGRSTPGRYQGTATSVGDGGRVSSSWIWKVHVVLRSLMGRYYR